MDRQVLERLTLDEGVVPGQVRTHSVVVGKMYRGAPAADCNFLLEGLCEWLASEDFAAPEGTEMVPAHVGRVARRDAVKARHELTVSLPFLLPRTRSRITHQVSAFRR